MLRNFMTSFPFRISILFQYGIGTLLKRGYCGIKLIEAIWYILPSDSDGLVHSSEPRKPQTLHFVMDILWNSDISNISTLVYQIQSDQKPWNGASFDFHSL